MHSMWVSLKESVNCGSKLTDVVRRQENNTMSGKYISRRKENSERKLIQDNNIMFNNIMFGDYISRRKENSERKLIQENNIMSGEYISRNENSERRLIQENNIMSGNYMISRKENSKRRLNIQENNIMSRKENSERKLIHGVNNPIHRRHDINKQYYELRAGEPSRNVIEMIFRAASTNPMKQSRKIKTVLKVKNSLETLRRFEIYREMVKKKAYEQYKMHPRIMVDGNEQLRFYGTTMSCCQGEPSWVSELCIEPSCGVCRMIQSSFSTEGMTKKKGIQLSSSSECLSDDSKSKTVKRAVIVCRIIAGRVGNMVEAENEENYDSIQSERWSNNTADNLIVQNPSAVLPCFVVVFT